MPLTFVVPLFLGGFALLVAPWIIHRIRRPEREETRFSSLMFVPHTRREVIERKRLQHILLMLMRMAMLALLALAFARPYFERKAAAIDAGPGTGWHVVLLDTSYSMGSGNWFNEAKKKARSIIDSIKPTDRVGVISFSRTPETIAPLVSEDDPEAGSAASARRAIEGARVTEETTAYVPALQAAQSMISATESQLGSAPSEFVVHLISDFQRGGLPDHTTRWKLDSRIDLECAEIGEPARTNCAIEDVSVRESKPGELRIRGKVRNWSVDQKIARTVRLAVEGREPLTSNVTIEPGAARQVSFQLPIDAGADLEGRLELEDDLLALDNRRFFARKAEGRRRVALLSDETSEAGQSAARFLASALPEESDLPWRLEVLAPEKTADALRSESGRPSILIVRDPAGLPADAAGAVRRYVEAGGRLLLTLDSTENTDALNQSLLARWGVRSEGPMYEEKSESRFALLSWVDFEHPIFFPLRSPQFNDFSSVRFYNHHRLSIVDSQSNEKSRAIARFESDDGAESPAMVEVRDGDGRVVIWAFGLDIEWSNLPRSVKFIPLFYETLSWLRGGGESQRSWEVGEAIAPPAGTGRADETWLVRLPGESDDLDASDPETVAQIRARESGLARWRNGGSGSGTLVEAVNVHATESNPERITPEELELKLTAPRMEPAESSPLDLERGVVTGTATNRHEYWRLLIALLFAFFFLESWTAAAIWRKKQA